MSKETLSADGDRQRECASCGRVDNPECRNVTHMINEYRKDDEREALFQEEKARLEAEDAKK